MKVEIYSDLVKIYKDSHKNIDKAIMTVLDSLDDKVYEKAISFALEMDSKVDEHEACKKCKYEKQEVELGEAVTEQLQETFDNKVIDDGLINILAWVAVLFPEI